MAVNVLINGQTHNVHSGVRLPLADGSGYAVYNYVYDMPHSVELLNALFGTGSQWIDTELKMTYPASGYELKLVFELTDTSQNMLIMGEKSVDKNQIAFIAERNDISYSRSEFSQIVKDTKYAYVETDRTADLNGRTNTVATTLVGITPSFTTALFAKKVSATTVESTSIAKMKLYEFSYSEGGNEVIHLLPALDSNGVAGMYDTVTKRMFYSQTDAFQYEEKTE